jgi:hypothetical protein
MRDFFAEGATRNKVAPDKTTVCKPTIWLSSGMAEMRYESLI